MRRRVVSLLWLCGAGFCRLAAWIEKTSIHEQAAIAALKASALSIPEPRGRAADVVVPTSAGPVLMVSIDGRTQPWQATGSSRIQ